MSQRITLTAIPGQVINQALPSTGKIQAIDLANGTPFDLDYSGFGVMDVTNIPAGTMFRFHEEVFDSGKITITPNNNVGISGAGVINLAVYFTGEKLPPGTFPITIPAQVVQAKVSTITSLVNDGAVSGTQIIESTPSGDASSAVSVTNSGDVILGNATHKGSITIAQGLYQVNSSGNEIVASVQNNGTETVQLTAVWNNAVAGKTVQVDASGNVNVGHTNPSGSNNVNVQGNVRINLDLALFDNGGISRPFCTILPATNSNTIFSNANDGLLHIMNSAQTQDIAKFADTNLITTLLGALNISFTGTVVNGGVAGTLTWWQFLQGDLKVFFASLVGFRTGVAQNIALPTAFVTQSFIWTGNWVNPITAASCGMQLLASGIAQNMNPYNGLSNFPGQTNIARFMLGEITTGFDTVSIVGNANWTGNGSGTILLVGR